jgi:uncharacterized coiled-coil protein SlyX
MIGKRTLQGEETSTSKEQSFLEMMTSPSSQERGPVAVWYRLTAPPALPENATYIQKEKIRRGRLLSLIALALILGQGLVTFGSFRTSVYLGVLDASSLLIYCITLFINKQGKATLAGIVLVGTLEFTLVTSFLFLGPITPYILPVLALFVVVEVLAASLLPVNSVFVLFLVNSVFIILYLKFQQHDALFEQVLRDGYYYNEVILPIALQLVVAVVTYLWVRSYTQAIMRADRAEVIAKLEHMVASQKEEVEEEKRQLELGIQQLIVVHTQAINGHINQRIPLPEAKVLWPLAVSLNNLFARLRGSYRAEYELQRMNKAIEYLAHVLNNAEITQEPVLIKQTGTALDPVLLQLDGKSIRATKLRHDKQSGSSNFPRKANI